MTDTAETPLARLAIEMDRAPYHHFLKPEPISADADTGTVVIKLTNRPEFRRTVENDDLHGGIIATLIDMTGHAAVAVKTGRVSPTIDIRVDFIRPGSGPHFIATGKLIRAGRSVGRADIEVMDSQGRLVAIGRGTFSTL
jgi:uncharacterized protein (TIGR00369 family)